MFYLEGFCIKESAILKIFTCAHSNLFSASFIIHNNICIQGQYFLINCSAPGVMVMSAIRITSPNNQAKV